MKRASGGFDPSYNAQTAVDDTTHIIVATEVGNNAADVGPLLPMLEAVKDDTGQAPEQALADAAYRSEQNIQALADTRTELVVALGREGKRCAEVAASKSPDTAAVAAKLQTDEGSKMRQRGSTDSPQGRSQGVLGACIAAQSRRDAQRAPSTPKLIKSAGSADFCRPRS